MLWPLIAMALGFTFYYLTLLLMRVRSELLESRIRALESTMVAEGRAPGLAAAGSGA